MAVENSESTTLIDHGGMLFLSFSDHKGQRIYSLPDVDKFLTNYYNLTGVDIDDSTVLNENIVDKILCVKSINNTLIRS